MTRAMDPAPPSPLPVPANFPVSWEHPSEERMLWIFQRMHFPEPITPLDEWFVRGEFDGVSHAAEAYSMPIRGTARRINTYAYAAIYPVPASPEQAEEQARQAQEKLGAAMARLEHDWTSIHLPEIKQHLAFWDAFDLRAASLPALSAHLEETIVRRERLWDIHFLIWFPAYTAISLFDDLYRDLFGATSALGAYRLLQGFGSKTVETTHALWQLSRRALGIPEVRQALEERAAADVVPALEASSQGRAFLAELRAYLNEYGQRSDKWIPSTPSWIEDPAPVIKNLKDYITQPDRDLAAELAALAMERERSIAEAREQLGDHPRRGEFEFLLKAAQMGTLLTEEHGFWLDFRGWHVVRRVFLECGRRLVGALEQPDDVFSLTIEELRETLAALPRIDRRRVVAGRRAEMGYFRAIQPPPLLGTPPAGPPPDDPVSRAIGKFFGAPPPPSAEPGLVRGTAGAPGWARGPARVIRSLREAGRLQPGDVLVAETTAPPWTPLFATAAAVVTDTGGVLSHCAIVAREYGIPAVVGTGSATAVIRDGQLLEVDGNTGVVRIIS